MFSKMKDAGTSLAIKTAVNSKIKEYGEMLKFSLDSKTKSIEMEVMLDGEKEPLHIKVNSYSITEEDGKNFLVANDIVTSRAWINTIAKQYLNGQKVEIPSEYVSILKMMV